MTLPVHVTVLELLVELNPAVRANASKAINCVWWMVLGGRVRLRGRERVCVCVCVGGVLVYCKYMYVWG